MGRLDNRPGRRKAAVWALALGALATVAAPDANAQSALGSLFGPRLGAVIPRIDYEGTLYGDEPVEGRDSRLGITRHDVSLRVPVHQNTRDEWSVGLHGRLDEIDTRAVLPDTGERFPSELWDVAVGTTYRHRFERGWIGGVTASVGSASDEPFHGLDETTVAATASLRIPHGPRNAWLLGLNYSNNRDFLNHVPLPVLGYWYQPADRLLAIVGIPFAVVRARVGEDLTLGASYFPEQTVHASATCRLSRLLALYAAFDWDDALYLRAGRPDEDDRLGYDEKRISGGVVVSLTPRVSLDLAGGYAFDRLYFEGDDDERDRNRLDIGDGAFGALRLVVGL